MKEELLKQTTDFNLSSSFYLFDSTIILAENFKQCQSKKQLGEKCHHVTFCLF